MDPTIVVYKTYHVYSNYRLIKPTKQMRTIKVNDLEDGTIANWFSNKWSILEMIHKLIGIFSWILLLYQMRMNSLPFLYIYLQNISKNKRKRNKDIIIICVNTLLLNKYFSVSSIIHHNDVYHQLLEWRVFLVISNAINFHCIRSIKQFNSLCMVFASAIQQSQLLLNTI